MASDIENLNGNLRMTDSQESKVDRQENKKLRNQGLEYISKTGKTIAAKKQPEQLCNCPQRCDEKVPEAVRKHLFGIFYKLGDHIQQNHFLQKYIEVRSVRKRLWDDDEQRIGGRLQRRVSCKYHIPLRQIKEDKDKLQINGNNNEKSKDENNSTDVNSGSKKGIPVNEDSKTAERNSNPNKDETTVEVCQKAFMNMYAITEKRIRLQREKLILKTRQDAGMPAPPDINDGAAPLWTHELINELGPLLIRKQILANISTFHGKNSPPDIPSKILLAIDNDIAIVSNFFCNQLWKPEYTGCDKMSPTKNKTIDKNSKSISTI